MSALPARVRVSPLPLPPAPVVAARLSRLFEPVTLTQLRAAAVAVAGGKVIGAVLRLEAGEAPQLHLDAAWRGRGIEQALLTCLSEQP